MIIYKGTLPSLAMIGNLLGYARLTSEAREKSSVCGKSAVVWRDKVIKMSKPPPPPQIGFVSHGECFMQLLTYKCTLPSSAAISNLLCYGQLTSEVREKSSVCGESAIVWRDKIIKMSEPPLVGTSQGWTSGYLRPSGPPPPLCHWLY